MKLQGHSGLGVWQWVWPCAQLRCFQQLWVISVHLKALTEGGKRSEVAVSSSWVWYTKLSDRSWNLVTPTTDRPIQVTLTNCCYLFSPAGQSEMCMYRYRHVETDLCLIMFPALPLLPLLLYPLLFLHRHQLQSDFHFPPPHNHSCFLRICWADATSPNVTNWTRTSTKFNAMPHTHTLAITSLIDFEDQIIMLAKFCWHRASSPCRLSVAETAYKSNWSAGQFDQYMKFSMHSLI